MLKLSDQRGFAFILEILLVAVVIGVIAAGLLIAKAGTNKGPQSIKMNSANYLHIRELGLKIPLTDRIKDLTYGYDSDFFAKNPDPQLVGLSSLALAKISESCKAGGTSGPLGAIGKTTNPNQPSGALVVDNKTVFKFGSTYVFYREPGANCNGTPGFLKASTEQRAAFLAAFAKIQPE